MFLLQRPGHAEIDSFLSRSKLETFSYDHVGSSRSTLPPGYVSDHNRVILGTGEDVYKRSVNAVRGWCMFNINWVKLYPFAAPIEVGQTVAVLVSHLGFYSLNAARIVYVIDEADRFGFAYGTLADHGECGEERFCVEYDGVSGEVHYDIIAFSRPQHILAKFGYPVVRHLQRSFARDSMKAMAKAVVAYDKRS